jgi:hypothetical protein
MVLITALLTIFWQVVLFTVVLVVSQRVFRACIRQS